MSRIYEDAYLALDLKQITTVMKITTVQEIVSYGGCVNSAGPGELPPFYEVHMAEYGGTGRCLRVVQMASQSPEEFQAQRAALVSAWRGWVDQQ